MCGIAGFVDFQSTSSRQILEDCTNTIAHRGPDGSGFEFIQHEDFSIGLGHRRLSIIDLSDAGRQPMWYKHWCLIFNGEMYNYQEVKDELIAKGHSFKSHSDTEVVLHAYEEWGAAGIEKFIGMFTFVIFDNEKKEFFAIRDRAGVKPFFYYWHEGLFIFASEFLRDAKDMRVLEEKGFIDNDRNMDEILRDGGAGLFTDPSADK